MDGELDPRALRTGEPDSLDGEINALRPEHARHQRDLERRRRRHRRGSRMSGSTPAPDQRHLVCVLRIEPSVTGSSGFSNRKRTFGPSITRRSQVVAAKRAVRAAGPCRAPRNPGRSTHRPAAPPRRAGQRGRKRDGLQRDAMQDVRLLGGDQPLQRHDLPEQRIAGRRLRRSASQRDQPRVRSASMTRR